MVSLLLFAETFVTLWLPADICGKNACSWATQTGYGCQRNALIMSANHSDLSIGYDIQLEIVHSRLRVPVRVTDETALYSCFYDFHC